MYESRPAPLRAISHRASGVRLALARVVVERGRQAKLAIPVLGRVIAIWSDASPGAARIDTPFHQLRGALYARARPVRLALRRVIGRALRLFRPKGNR
ncbi:MAG: hypothetical protein JWO85_1105 [Candidatus Eremiobacteraeota bacterium]|nr:hypothetical protein [Candidatus Eremiobacteraeota bacterium]